MIGFKKKKKEKMTKENLEEADEVEGPRLKAGKRSLDLLPRPLSLTFEDQGQHRSGDGSQPEPEECVSGTGMGPVPVICEWTMKL